MYTGIIILNYNNPGDTVQCIRSIERYNTAPVKYIVIDNGSDEAHPWQEIDAFFQETFPESYRKSGTGEMSVILPKVTLLLNTKNSGYAKGNNIGLEWAFRDPEIDHILLINNDILFTGDIIPTLLEDSGKLDRCGIVTPVLIKRDGKTVDYCFARKFVSNWNIMVPFLLHNRNKKGRLTRNARKQNLLSLNPELLQRKEPFPIDYPSGACFFATKEVLQKAEGFDPGTFLYYEEIILYKRLSRIGLQNYCDPRIRAIHLGGNSTRMSDNLFLQRCNLESADLYFRKYGSCTLTQRIVWALTKASWKLRLYIKNTAWKKS